MSTTDTCIFCLEGSQPHHTLIYNVKCRCNYAFHTECYDVYTRKTVCPICRAEVGDIFTLDVEELPTPNQNDRVPSPLPQLQQSQQNQEQSEYHIYALSNKAINICFFLLILVIFFIILIESLKNSANT